MCSGRANAGNVSCWIRDFLLVLLDPLFWDINMHYLPESQVCPQATVVIRTSG